MSLPIENTRRHQSPTLLPTEHPDAIALFTSDHDLSWVGLETQAIRVANALAAEGIGPGEVWALLAHNRVEWGELLLGNARAGSRLVPLNWHLTAMEISDLLVDSGATLVIVDESLTGVLEKAVASVAAIRRVVVLGREYETWIATADDVPLTERKVGSPMLFTGGTTGRSKGVIRSDQGGDATDWAKRWASWAGLVRLPEEGLTLITTPLYHALGLAVFAASLASGVPVVIAPRFDPEGTLSLIEQHKITSGPMVPTQFVRLLKLDDEVKAQYDLSSIQWVLHTAAPCPAWAKRAMIDWFGPVIYEMYGASEGIGPAIADSHEWLERPGTVGTASARVQYSIVDDDGHDLPAGEVGTIYCLRDDGAPEYHGDPEKTAAMRLPDGRFTVGDLGWLDHDGYLYLADRRVDLILTGGANVYPAEIEAVLIEHPDVADAAVFGIPDPEWGQQVKAVIEPGAGRTLDIANLREFAAERLASYKVPRSFDIVDALPREAHGKLKKRLLRDPYWVEK